MEVISSTDILVFKAIVTASLLYSASHLKDRWTKRPIEPLVLKRQNGNDATSNEEHLPPTRSIPKRLQQTKRKCVVFYGSQTGTAEKLALAFARDAKARYGMLCLVADLDEYDLDSLRNLDSDCAAVFFLATYGEGEPTDNALDLSRYLASIRDNQDVLANVKYTGFGLGSTSYKHFNAMIKHLDASLSNSGAQQLCGMGEGDDGKGSLENDFLQWKEHALPLLASALGFEEKGNEYHPTFVAREEDQPDGEILLDGEPNLAHAVGRVKGPFTARNPFPARVAKSRQLFHSASERKCIHIEFDVSGSTLTYNTGDHLAIQPFNRESEVDRFLEVFGLAEKRNITIALRSNDPTLTSPYSAPTTHEAAVRHYLDISGPVSRHFLFILARFCDDGDSQAALLRLAQDQSAFVAEVQDQRISLAQLLQRITKAKSLRRVPFGVLVENLPSLKPRYYSINSSSICSKRTVSITAVEETKYDAEGVRTFTGVNSGYLSSLTTTEESRRLHKISGPRNRFLDQATAYIHVRRSNFRLPKKVSTPVIMIGPGTGVAPFRAFVQERAAASSRGEEAGKTMLLYGCRRSDEDFLYKEEWKELSTQFRPGVFEMHTAFSREPGQEKQYVQDLITLHGQALCRMILQDNAHVYVCGNARYMAKGVYAAFLQALEEYGHLRGNTKNSPEAILDAMKKDKRWLEDVW